MQRNNFSNELNAQIEKLDAKNNENFQTFLIKYEAEETENLLFNRKEKIYEGSKKAIEEILGPINLTDKDAQELYDECYQKGRLQLINQEKALQEEILAINHRIETSKSKVGKIISWELKSKDGKSPVRIRALINHIQDIKVDI